MQTLVSQQEIVDDQVLAMKHEMEFNKAILYFNEIKRVDMDSPGRFLEQLREKMEVPLCTVSNVD
jgi:hypothetical protein